MPHHHHGRKRAAFVFAAFLLLAGGNAHAQDSEALVALYNATGGANWTNNTNWLSNEALSEWHVVSTDVNGRVTRLYLPQNELSGETPVELGNLTYPPGAGARPGMHPARVRGRSVTRSQNHVARFGGLVGTCPTSNNRS